MTTNPIEFDGKRYRQTSAHQREWGLKLIADLNLRGEEHILDVGCGDGGLTSLLAERVPHGSVCGLDASAGMIAAAADQRRPNLRFVQADIRETDFTQEFDLIFSNAALHWVDDHPALLAILHGALRPHGIMRVNFAAAGNCQNWLRIARELMDSNTYRQAFHGFRWPYFMPSVSEYRQLMDDSPFCNSEVWGENADRLFPSETDMLGWLDQPAIVPFRAHLPDDLAVRFQADAAAEMVRSTRRADGSCFETFRRLHVRAVR